VTDTPPPPPGPPSGSPYGPGGYGHPLPPANHPSAVPSLVCGIVSLVCCGIFTGIPAIVMGSRALREIRADRSRYAGEGLAQAGLWTGVAGTALSVLGVLLFVGVLAGGGAVHSQ
jgi:Domain of unknown function (DUF4190)